MPSDSRVACVFATCGLANGSSALGYAAVAGRWLAGKDFIQLMNGSSEFTTGSATSNTFGSFSLNTRPDPPAPSTNAYPYRCATCAAGAVSNEENGPKVRSTCFTVIKSV